MVPRGEAELRRIVEAAALQHPEALLVAFGHASRLADAPRVRLHRLVEALFVNLGPAVVLRPANRALAQQALHAIANHHLGTFVLLLEAVHAVDSSSTATILNIVQVWSVCVSSLSLIVHPTLCVDGKPFKVDGLSLEAERHTSPLRVPIHQGHCLV
jgi:hypothetical protein